MQNILVVILGFPIYWLPVQILNTVIFNCIILIGGWFHGKPYERPSKEDIETEIPLEPVDIDEDEFYSWIKYELITFFHDFCSYESAKKKFVFLEVEFFDWDQTVYVT